MVTHVGPPGRILLLNTSVSTISSTSTQLGFWATCADWSRKVTGSVTGIAWSRAGFSISSLEFHTMHGGRTLETLSTCMDCLPTLSLGLPIWFRPGGGHGGGQRWQWRDSGSALYCWVGLMTCCEHWKPYNFHMCSNKSWKIFNVRREQQTSWQLVNIFGLVPWHVHRLPMMASPPWNIFGLAPWYVHRWWMVASRRVCCSSLPLNIFRICWNACDNYEMCIFIWKMITERYRLDNSLIMVW